MRGKIMPWMLLGIVLLLPCVLADTDHGDQDWNITADTNLSGYHYRIRTLSCNASIGIIPFNGSSDSGWLKINATRITGSCTFPGDGRGGGGGSGGGGGGGNDGDGSLPAFGYGGNGTGQDGTNGTNGDTGTSSTCGSGVAGEGGAGGNGYNGITGGLGADDSNSCGADRTGFNGTMAPANNDPSIAINASMGYGGGGGGGGTGGARQAGNDGGGGAGGGMGGDGGAYLILIARDTIMLNGTILMRSGQDVCPNGTDGGSGQSADGYGGNGSRNNQTNCAHSSGGDGGGSDATGGDGGNGGAGGPGAGGMVVIAANTVNLTGARINVSGGNSTNGGTIKILYRQAVIANASYDGYSRLVYSNYSDPWFTSNSISWLQNISNHSQYWNTTFFLDLNATNSSECNVSTYTSNDSLYPINATTGVVTWAANFSRIGNRTVLFRANDTCSNTIDQVIPVQILYTTPNISSIAISPSPTGTSNPLVCTVSLNNPDGGAFSNTTMWFKNGTLQAGLTNAPNVSTGNLSIGDQWICQYNGTDNRTILGPQNSTTLVLGDSTKPIIWTFTLSPGTVVVNTESTTILMNCTDNEGVGTVTAEITDPDGIKENRSMSPSSGLYSVSYTPVKSSNGGLHTVRGFCADGSSNTNITTSSINFTAVAGANGSGGGGGGGGGGGTTTVIVGEQCEFSIVRPTNGFVNTLCPKGGRSNTFEFVLQNEETTPQTYTTRFNGVDCTIDQSTFTVNGKAQHASYISACVCPTNVSIEGSIEITTATCTGELPIKLYNTWYSRVAFDQDFLLKFLIGFFIVVVIITGIILAK